VPALTLASLGIQMGPDVWHWCARAPEPGGDLRLCGEFKDTAKEARTVVGGLAGEWSQPEMDGGLMVDVFTCEDGAVYVFGTVPRPQLAVEPRPPLLPSCFEGEHA
jgi:hypothetical protein